MKSSKVGCNQGQESWCVDCTCQAVNPGVPNKRILRFTKETREGTWGLGPHGDHGVFKE